MSTQTSYVSTYGRYIGRVGAMAAALGIGVLVATTPGVANADSTSTSGASAGGGTDSNGGSSTTSTTDTDTAKVGTTDGASAAGSTVGTSSSSVNGSTSTGTGSSATDTTKAAGTTSPSIEVAPGVTISANSIKLGKHTITIGLGTKTPPAAAAAEDLSGVQSTPESDETTASDETTDSSEGSTQPNREQISNPATTGSKSTHFATAKAGTRSLTTASSNLPTLKSTVADAIKSVKAPSATLADSGTTAAAESFKVNTVSTALAAPATAGAAAALVSPAAPATGVIGFLNHVVTKLLNPFLSPAPNTPEPVTPVVWAVLGWVRRNLFNQAPTITHDPTRDVQTGQTVTGYVGGTDPESDPLTYTVTQGPEHGTLTLDKATGKYSYTPDDIDYDGVQTDSFTVSVTDGNKVNLLGLTTPRSDEETITVAVKPPTAVHTVVPLPAGFTDAAIPRFAADGKSLLFSATPPGSAADARREIYQVNVDGTGLTCITCGLADPTPPPASSTPAAHGTPPTTPNDLFKPVPFEDGSGRILMQSVATSGTNAQGQSVAGSYTNVIYEPGTDGQPGQLVRVVTPAGKAGVIVVDPQREMRVSPDGTHVLFSQIQIVPSPADPAGTGGCQSVACGFSTAVPIVGTLTPGVDASGNKVYNITDARVVYPVGEGKQWTHDGKGVIVQGGLYDSGNVDDVYVDLATGQATRLTGNLDYDEDVDLSPNNEWLAIDSARGQDALTPASQIQRPAFVPLLIQGSVYTVYAGPTNATNISNQPWLVAKEDDLNGEDGIPLFVNGDGWVARSMPSWNADGTEVAFWEANASDPTGNTSRLVVDYLQYTTSAYTPLTSDEQKTPDVLSSTLPTLASNTPQQVQLIPPGTYNGTGGPATGGTAVVTQTTDAATGHIIRSVQYTNYVNEDGLILNGTESTDQTVAQNLIHYTADIKVTDSTGAQRGSLTGDVTINKLTRTITPTTPDSQITSTLDGKTLVLLDPARLAASRAAV